MVLVFYIVLATILIILAIIIALYLSELEIKIKNLHMSSENKKENNNNILIVISLKIGKCKWFNLKMNKNKIQNIYAITKKMEYKNNKYMKNKIDKLLQMSIKNKNIRRIAGSLEINLEKFRAEILLGTEDPIITSYLVALVAIVISNILPHITKKESDVLKYRVSPIYKQKNMYSLTLESIISIGIRSLIHVALDLRKEMKFDDNYENEEIRDSTKIKVHAV